MAGHVASGVRVVGCNPEGNSPSEGLVVGERMILKCILMKRDGRVRCHCNNVCWAVMVPLINNNSS
jgi:hypothetical protein